MGRILAFECPQCGYQTRLLVGGGRQDCERETALSAVPYDAALAAALKNNTRFQINRIAAVCHHCHKLMGAAYVTYQPKGTRKRNVAQTCPDCGGALDWQPLNTDSVPCPVCGRTAPLVFAGLWD